MNPKAIKSDSPLGLSRVTARKDRLAFLGSMVFDLLSERQHGVTLNTFDDVENADLIAAMRSCCHFEKHITCIGFDDPFAIAIEGIDGHNYVLLFSLLGPGFSIHAARARHTNLTLIEGSPGLKFHESTTLDLSEDHSEQIKLGEVSVDRAFLIGMSMAIGLMDEQGDDEDEKLAPLVQAITPTGEELRRFRESRPAPIIALDDDDLY